MPYNGGPALRCKPRCRQRQRKPFPATAATRRAVIIDKPGSAACDWGDPHSDPGWDRIIAFQGMLHLLDLVDRCMIPPVGQRRRRLTRLIEPIRPILERRYRDVAHQLKDSSVPTLSALYRVIWPDPTDECPPKTDSDYSPEPLPPPGIWYDVLERVTKRYQNEVSNEVRDTSGHDETNPSDMSQVAQPHCITNPFQPLHGTAQRYEPVIDEVTELTTATYKEWLADTNDIILHEARPTVIDLPAPQSAAVRAVERMRAELTGGLMLPGLRYRAEAHKLLDDALDIREPAITQAGQEKAPMLSQQQPDDGICNMDID
jgi:hypothetical protein